MSKPFDLKFIPFSQLHISKLNMRHSETAPAIDDILPSVKKRGIRQPLIVRREGGTAKKPKYGIVAGRRRHFCLANIAAEGTGIIPEALSWLNGTKTNLRSRWDGCARRQAIGVPLASMRR